MNFIQKRTIELLQQLCPEEYVESIVGDLNEQYDLNLERKGKFAANWLFVYNGIKFLRLGILRRKKLKKSNPLAMLRNYLLVALRNFKKQKLYHSINFIGLTIGLSCCALVLLYLNHELSFDDFHQDSTNTYRVTGELNERTWFPSIMNEYAERLMTGDFPEVLKATKFRRAPMNYAIHQNNRISTRAIVTNTGSDFFKVFDFASIEGNKQNMLKEPKSAVLSESLAKSIFEEGPFVGKIFQWDTLSLKVTGVLEDLPSNTHLAFDLLIAENVPLVGVFTYITLHEGANVEQLEKKISEIDIGNDNYYISEIDLQPIESIHLAEPLTFELKPPGNKKYLYLFSGIALFILVISCTNYMNLSSAIYAGRTKEMAVRKMMGSTKKDLAIQFLIESVFMTLLTIPVVLLITSLVLPIFSNFVEVPLANDFLTSPELLLLLLSVALITSLFTGIYPGISMTHFSVLRLFKGHGLANSNGLNMRKILLTGQFIILLLLGTGAFFINKQLQFIRTKDLGINQTDIVKVSNIYDIYRTDKYQTVKSIALSNSNILGVTVGTPPGTESYGFPYQAEGHEERSDALSFATDLDYFDVMEVEGLYGDFFTRRAEDQPNVSLLVNEKFVELMGWEDPIGKKVTMSPSGRNPRDHFVAGVFKNYHALSLHKEIVPQFIFARKNIRGAYENILVRIDMNNIKESFEAIEEAWSSVMPNSPIICEFMNEDIQKAYEQEQKAGELSLILSVLAIVLSVMGLVGLASYLSELRTKEVGIRKVLGASFGQILLLLNREFVFLILIATAIAGTIGYYFISKWLEAFAYRTSIEIIVFPLAGLLVLGITFLTVSIQSGKAASKNPVESIRYE